MGDLVDALAMWAFGISPIEPHFNMPPLVRLPRPPSLLPPFPLPLLLVPACPAGC